MAHRGPTFGQCGQKANFFLNTHPISVHTKFELDCVNTFWDNDQKPPFSVIFCPLECQWPISKSLLDTHPIIVHTKFELDYVNTFWDNDWKPPFWPIFSNFLATRGQNWANVIPKANQFWTLAQQMPTLNLKWIEWWHFQIMVGNPGGTDRQTDGRMHEHTDGCSPFLCPVLTSSAGTIISLLSEGSGI